MMKRKKLKFGIKQTIYEDDSGVSPVIAVILMVAITVVMAAIVSSWSAGVKAPTAPTTVGLDISRNNDTLTIVVTAIDPASASPLTSMNISYKNYSTGSPVPDNELLSNVDIGTSIDIDTWKSDIQQVIITAGLKDGSKKVIFSREI